CCASPAPGSASPATCSRCARASDDVAAATSTWRRGYHRRSMTTTPRARIPGVRLLHAPGPTRVPEEVLAAMLRQPTDLADPRVAALVASCEAGMKALLRTASAEVFFYAANGHGGWEAVIAN